MKFAKRLKNAEVSPTLKLSSEIKRLISEGKDIINMTVGQPDFPTPQFVVDSLEQAIQDKRFGYTQSAGIPELRESIAKRESKRQNIPFKSSQIQVTVGGKQAIYNAAMALLSPGDEVIIPSPYWVSYKDITYISDGIPVIVPSKFENNYKITAHQLENAITQKTKLFILNTPSNPTGAVYSETELKAFSEILLSPHGRNVWILLDSIYELLVYNESIAPSLLHLCPALKDRIIVVNGLSKSHAMTGWRLGYAAASEEYINAAQIIQSQSTSQTSSLTQYAALAAYNHNLSFLDAFIADYKERRDYILKTLDTIPELSYRKPEGAFYVYINCEKIIGKRTPKGKDISNDMDFVNYLITEGIGVIPGGAFGLSPYIRMSYAVSLEKVKIAMDRLRTAISKLNE